MLLLKAFVPDSPLNNAPLIFLDTLLKVSLSTLLLCAFIGAVSWAGDKVEERYGVGTSLAASFFMLAVPLYTIFITVIRLKSNR